MKPRLLPYTLFLLLSGGTASAEVNVNALAADLQSQGFTRIEMRETPNQLKVEAIRGTEKVETIYDKSTGAVLKSETEAVGAFENTTPGVSLRQRNRDFLRVSDGQSSDNSSDDVSSDDSTSDDDGVSGSDDGPNHDANDDKGGDDSSSDSDHDASDDKGGDSGSGGSDDSGESHGGSGGGSGGSGDSGGSGGSSGSGGDGHGGEGGEGSDDD